MCVPSVCRQICPFTVPLTTEGHGPGHWLTPIFFSPSSPFPGSLVQAVLCQLYSVMGQAVKVICSSYGSSCDWYQPKFPGCAPVTVIYYNDLGLLDIPSRFSRSQSSSMSTVTISGVQAQDKTVC